jgi:hypothetical protein
MEVNSCSRTVARIRKTGSQGRTTVEERNESPEFNPVVLEGGVDLRGEAEDCGSGLCSPEENSSRVKGFDPNAR